MQRHTKVYLRYFDLGEQDIILCEACGRKAVDIHHIQGRGKDKDIIENLMALCRKCHDLVHSEQISDSTMQYIHNNVLNGHRKQFLK